MPSKALPEIERQALVQQDLHAMRDRSESFASSRARTAIS
jgi:hypothetical protein